MPEIRHNVIIKTTPEKIYEAKIKQIKNKMEKSINNQVMTTQEVAARFQELAKQEKWFEIQDELFSDNVRSVEPANSPYFKNEEGKGLVRKKGEDWVSKVKEVHKLSTSQPIVAGNHFAVARETDIMVEEIGRVLINEIMLYEVKDGQIISEQFFY